jgi:hypothetical protein
MSKKYEKCPVRRQMTESPCRDSWAWEVIREATLE